MNKIYAFLLVFLSIQASGQITVYPNEMNQNVVHGNEELVTMGLPFAPCELTDIDDFRLLDERNNEVPIFTKITMKWPARGPCNTESIRAIKIQFNFDATNGIQDYSWDQEGKSLTISEQPVSEITHNNPAKGGASEPRVYAIVDPVYLVTTGIIPPTSAASDNIYDSGYYPQSFSIDGESFDFTTSTAANWLFDRTSATYIQALRTGNPAVYREAYVQHEFWLSKMEVTGQNTTVENYCVGGFDMDGKADTYGSGGDGCDSKYIYLQPYKLHLALTGDDSWTPSENGTPVYDERDDQVKAIAELLFTGSTRGGVTENQPAGQIAGIIAPYDEWAYHFTERDAGFTLQALLNACELTLDSACQYADTAINNLYAMQSKGYLEHSYRVHEGTGLPWLGTLAQSYTDAAEIVLENTVGDYIVPNGNTVRIGEQSGSPEPTVLESTQTSLKLDTPISAEAGTEILVRSSPNSNVSYNVDVTVPSDHIFSPWMQSIVADGVWQYYHWTTDEEQKQKAAKLLLGFAEAYTAYAVDRTRGNSETYALIENAFDLSILDLDITGTGCGLTNAPFVRYFANDLITNVPYGRHINGKSAGADQHIPEGLFQVALGIHFEPDSQKREAMVALANDMLNWYEQYECTAGYGPPRAYGWQHKPNPFGTFQFITGSEGEPNIIQQAESDLDESNNLDLFVDDEDSSTPSDADTVTGPDGLGNSKNSSNTGIVTGPDGLGNPKSSPNTDTVTGPDGRGNSKDTSVTTNYSSPPAGESNTFTAVADSVINTGTPADDAFWVGMPDVNADGCLDLFSGTHNTSIGKSRMWLQNANSDTGCLGTFTYYSNSQGNYSQNDNSTRITSRYIFANVTGNAEGLPQIFGSDADIGNSAIYPINSQNPVYGQKFKGCQSGFCTSADINGDGNIEFINLNTGIKHDIPMVVDPENTNSIKMDTISGYTGGKNPLMPIDINGDSFPDLVNSNELGYWLYEPENEVFGEFIPAFRPREDICRDAPSRNHQLPIDYDNDGDFDIIFGYGAYDGSNCNYSEFYLVLYRNNGDGTFTDVTDVAGGSGATDGSLPNTTYYTTYSTMHSADFNNDGCTDFMIMSHTRSSGPWLYQNNCDGTFKVKPDAMEFTGGDFMRPWGGIGDFNNDGFIDVIMLGNNGDDDVVKGIELYRNEGNDNHWIKVRARGVGDNTDGYGTTVTMSQDGNIYGHRYLGHYSGGSYRFIAHAGLGDLSSVDLTVTFNAGAGHYTYSDIAVDQEVVVFPDGCLLTGWTGGDGWPLSSKGLECKKPD